MISHKYRCIYIHIPKTAGTSVELKLGLHGEVRKRGSQDHRTIRNLHDAIWPPSIGRYAPIAWLRYINQRYQGYAKGFQFLSKQQWDSYFKFAFVRNPWDRVYSWYRNVMRDEVHQKMLQVSKDCDFRQFVANHLEIWALRPQWSWIVDENDAMVVDYVGKFEALEADFEFVCRQIGMTDVALPKALHYGASMYKDAYDDASKTLVAKKYAKEIDYFEYSFGD